jgi:hypothetical protein
MLGLRFWLFDVLQWVVDLAWLALGMLNDQRFGHGG